MKIVNSSETLLVAKDGTILSFILGPIFAIIGLIGIFKPELYVEKLPIWVSILFVVMGIIAVLVTTSFIITCDRNKRIVRVTKSSLIKKTNVDIGFDDIRAIQLRQSNYNSYSKGRGYQRMTNSVAYVILNNGSSVQISMDSSTGSSRGLLNILFDMLKHETSSPLQRCLVTISEFINKPFEMPDPPSTQEVLGAIKDAVETSIASAQKGKNP